MSSISFTDYSTLVPASWLNEVNRTVHTDVFNVKNYGAVGNSSTDDTASIQAAVDAAEAQAASSGGALVYFPPSTGYYKLTSPLTVLASGITLMGAGTGSAIYNATGDAIRCGDNVTTYSDIKIQNLNVQANGANSICIKGQKTTNLRISNCNIANFHASSGDGIRLTDSWCSTIINNTFGSIMGYGIHVSSNANAMAIIGNRLDGGGPTATCGMYLDSFNGGTVMANAIETWTTGVNGKTVRGSRFSNYMETYTTGYLFDAAGAIGNYIGGFFASSGSTVSIKISAGLGYTIDSISCIGTHSGGAPIELTTGPGDVFIKGNIIHDDVYYVKWPINHLALRQHLELDRSVDDTYGYLTPITHTGSTGETTLKTYTGVKEHWGTGTRIDVRVAGRITGTAGAKDIRLKLAGTTIGTVSEVAGATDDWIIEASIDVASATVGQAVVKAWQGNAVEVGDVVQGGGVVLALSTTNPTITVTGQLGNAADSIIVTHWMIEVKN
jgi:hypothetical protein